MKKKRVAGRHNAATTDVSVVVLERADYVLQREVIRNEGPWLDDHLVLLLIASPRVDLGNTGDASKLGLHDPVMDGAQFGQRLRRVR